MILDAAKAPLPFISGAFAPLPCLKRTAGTFLHGAPLSRKSKTFAGKRRIRSKGGLLSDQGKRSKIDRGSVRAFGQSIQTKSFQIFRIRCFVTNLKCPARRGPLLQPTIWFTQANLRCENSAPLCAGKIYGFSARRTRQSWRLARTTNPKDEIITNAGRIGFGSPMAAGQGSPPCCGLQSIRRTWPQCHQWRAPRPYGDPSWRPGKYAPACLSPRPQWSEAEH